MINKINNLLVTTAVVTVSKKSWKDKLSPRWKRSRETENGH